MIGENKGEIELREKEYRSTCLPYGVYHAVEGDFLFNRGYQPIYKIIKKGAIPYNIHKWIDHIIFSENFYMDYDRESMKVKKAKQAYITYLKGEQKIPSFPDWLKSKGCKIIPKDKKILLEYSKEYLVKFDK